MRGIYTIVIWLYGLFLRFGGVFNHKARLWVDGRKGIFGKLENSMRSVDRKKNPIIWFHVSSLGEFEQGRPVIEAMRKHWPEKKILLTFFSPSGFEVRKNYDQADFVFYLPLDTSSNAKRFLEIVRPQMAIFVKYDFWFNFLKAVHDRKIPLIFISALFRKDQHFFSWYGGWSRKHLTFVDHFFVQNSQSAELLKSIRIEQCTIAGDTRFDRVYDIARQSEPLPLVGKFCDGKAVFVAGSSWEPDEAVFLPLTEKKDLKLKFIIAPHDTGPDRISQILDKLKQPSILYSSLTEANASTANILIIDCVGILSKLYRYATVAFIGGGFGSGLHNIQEPVTFGVPVLFGPVYHKFREARELVERGGASSVNSTTELMAKTRELLDSPPEHQRISAICRDYVEENRGATNRIMGYLEQMV